MTSIIHNLESLKPDRDTFLTIGKFDGVHLGHYHLLHAMVKAARAQGAQSAAITLHPNPLEVLAPQRQVLYLTTLEERIQRLAALGLDQVIVMRFDLQVASTPARQFVERILGHIRLRQLWAGPNFALGKDRQGDIAFLRALGEELGYTVQVVQPLCIGGEVVSGTRIRRLLSAGHIDEAAVLLGRVPSLPGRVVPGAARGHKLGYPTANLKIPDRLVLPADGIYAMRVQLEGEWLDGVGSIGVRPTFEADGRRQVEVYIFDFDRQIYGAELVVEFVARLRDELKFESVEALVAQIDRDVAEARAILANARQPILIQPGTPAGNGPGQDPTQEATQRGMANPKSVAYEEIEHTADVAIRVRGRDLAELFTNAAYGMWSLITPDLDAVKPTAEHSVEIEALDLEVLLVDWLSELLYLHETENEVYSEFEIHEISPTRLRATVRGGPTEGHSIRKHIKAVTFNDLSIEQTDEGYEATVVFDI
jgi:riboflavin kinase/FMN adenylyltransferase